MEPPKTITMSNRIIMVTDFFIFVYIILIDFYSVRSASMGRTLMALWAGINPAKSPDIINMSNAPLTTPTLTLGFMNISTGPTLSNKEFIP